MSARSAQHAAFGLALRERRHAVGLSQEGLADASGLDRTYVSGIERGERNPSLTNILKLAAAVQTPPAELFARTEALLADTGG
jgi:transcriptional regulator with XRE-family HTH domain